MNLDQAIGNLSQVLFQGRITMPGGSLTAQEHQELSNNFNFLVQRAKKVDELEKELNEESVPVEIPEPVESIEEDQDDSRTE